MQQFLSSLCFLAALGFPASPAVAEAFDFAAGVQGFSGTTGGTSSSASPFTHSDGRWVANGTEAGADKYTSSTLTSPAILVSGEVQIRLRHRYHFESGWDSAHLLVSVNGGPDQLGGADLGSFTENGYNQTLLDQGGTNPHGGKPAWTGDSSGMKTSALNLGELPAQTTIRIKLVATWDAASTEAAPNWEIFSLQIISGNEPLPSATWLVDRDVTNTAADFHDLQEAINSARPGDTIMVMPSGQSYGGIAIDRSLTLVGPGFGGAELFGRGRELHATLGQVRIAPSVSNVTLMGFFVDAEIVFLDHSRNEDTLPTRNILLYRNRTGRIHVGSDGVNAHGELNNFLAINNWITGTVKLADEFPGWSTEGAYFYNNRIGSHLDLYSETSSAFVYGAYAVFANNVFPNTWQDLDLHLGSFINNIVRRAPETDNNAGYLRGQRGMVVENNVFAGAWPTPGIRNSSWSPDDARNLLAKQITDVVRWEGDWWQNYELTSDSPAKGYGQDESDAGIFGGLHPWDVDQMPPLPFITKLEAPAVVSQGQGLKIRVEVRTNQ